MSDAGSRRGGAPRPAAARPVQCDKMLDNWPTMAAIDPLPPDDFHLLRERVFELIESDRLDQALDVGLKAEERYPAKGEVPFWLACIHGRAGRDAEGLAALRDGLARGLWWPDEWLLEDDDLASMREAADFGEIVASSRANQDGAGDEFVAESMILAPARDRDAVGVVLALHGWGGDAVAFSRAWWSAADAGYIVVVPESSQMPSPGFFIWTDRTLARTDVQTVWDEAAGAHGLAGLPLVVAGFSQGGGGRRGGGGRGAAPPPPGGRAPTPRGAAVG